MIKRLILYSIKFRQIVWLRIHVGMDEMYEMDRTYHNFYTQLAKKLIVFFSLC